MEASSTAIQSQPMDSVNFSCVRCRKRKIKCNRNKPCDKCVLAKVECHVQGTGERSRPVSLKHVQALESQVKSLDAFIRRLDAVDNSTCRALVASYAQNQPSSPSSPPQPLPLAQHHQDRLRTGGSCSAVVETAAGSRAPASVSSASPPHDSGALILAKAKQCRIRKLNARRAAQFYGGTAFFQMQPSASPRAGSSVPVPPSTSPLSVEQSSSSPQDNAQQLADIFPYRAQDPTCRQLITQFFQNVYLYNMCIYREWFLRDYDAPEGGPYYSEPLAFAICTVGALISQDPALKALAPVFAKRSEVMTLQSLEVPDLTILQTLLLLGQYEIGQGRGSKGWLYTGMAFRLTHEMGLHLDPDEWNPSKSESAVDREILRRVYWAVFSLDKQISLYFGRPPALYPHSADVRNTIRIPYPPEWEALLDKYICKGTSSTAFEDGIVVVGAFVHQVELAKIFHTIIHIFENRWRQPSEATAAAFTAQQVHTSLIQWLAKLPQKLHWNQWTVGKVLPHVLHLHMLFHTAMIILHRPPKEHLDDYATISDGVEVCGESLSAILRLLKNYGRYYRFELLPLDFVHTLSLAAEVVIVKKYVEKLSWEDTSIGKPLESILQVMEIMQAVFPCVQEIRESIIQNMRPTPDGNGERPEKSGSLDLDLMHLLQSGSLPFPGGPGWSLDGFNQIEAGDAQDDAQLGFLVTDQLLNEHRPLGDSMSMLLPTSGYQ